MIADRPSKRGIGRRSVLPRVQQHPNLTARRTSENSSKHTAAFHARVVLLFARVFHPARTDERQVFMRLGGGWLPIEMRAQCARLNPEVQLEILARQEDSPVCLRANSLLRNFSDSRGDFVKLINQVFATELSRRPSQIFDHLRANRKALDHAIDLQIKVDTNIVSSVPHCGHLVHRGLLSYSQILA
jgi:hypothetical protein